MGSVSCHRPKGQTHKEWFQDNFGPRHVILEASQARGGALYMAVQYDDPEHEYHGKVYAAVILTGWSPRSYYNFWYKTMDETCGPNEDSCPKKILDLLTPLDELYGEPFIGPLKQYQSRNGEYARNWRRRCEENLARKAARPKITQGTKLRFAQPLRFTSGMECSEFVYSGKGNRFEALPEGYMVSVSVSISKWRDRSFEVVKALHPDEAYAV